MNWLKDNRDILVATIILTVSLFLIKPYKYNFAINDDWDFYLHVKYFLDGIYIKNAFIDSAFILQGFIAMFWAKLFGLSFINLRLLTLVFFICFSAGVYILASLYGVSKRNRVFLVLTLTFNPIILISTLSFMTEIYFLTFFIWSFIFFKKYLTEQRPNYLLATSVLTGASLLVRQFGLVLFLSYSLGFLALFINTKDKKVIRDFILFSFIFGVFFSILMLFPKVPSRIVDDAGIVKHTLKLFSTLDDLKDSIFVLPFAFVYLSFFLLPTQVIHKHKLSLKKLIFLIPIGLLFATLLFMFDIFPIGNVLYIERLFAKTDYVSVITLFDNKIFKIIISTMLGINLAMLGYKTLKETRITKSFLLSSEKLTYLALCLLMFGVAFIAQGSFERYFINFFVLVTIFYFINYVQQDSTWQSFVIPFAILWTMSTFLIWDFFAAEGLKWKIASTIQPQIRNNENIHLSGTYLRYSHSIKQSNPYLLQVNRREKNFRCQVQRLYRGGDSKLFELVSKVEKSKKIRKFLKNPDIYRGKISVGFRDINYHENRIILQEEYFTPLNMFFNRKAYIAVFCFNEGKN